jgi:hypothetical protein
MTFKEAVTQALPCPECRMRGAGGAARIGNRRNRCTTCNNWAQNVMRLTRKVLKERHEDEYAQIRARVEKDLYPQVLEDFIRAHPGSGGS